jgi:hypothetical protein
MSCGDSWGPLFYDHDVHLGHGRTSYCIDIRICRVDNNVGIRRRQHLFLILSDHRVVYHQEDLITLWCRWAIMRQHTVTAATRADPTHATVTNCRDVRLDVLLFIMDSSFVYPIRSSSGYMMIINNDRRDSRPVYGEAAPEGRGGACAT